MEKEIGWYKESTNNFLCSNCFPRAEGLNKEDYKPIHGGDLNDNIYTCDKCGKELIRNKNMKQKTLGKWQLGIGILAIICFIINFVMTGLVMKYWYIGIRTNDINTLLLLFGVFAILTGIYNLKHDE